MVAIQGARQTGKSFLARVLLQKKLDGGAYFTFDDESTRSSAAASPRTFLLTHGEDTPLIIDEAQKVPAIFDAIKFEVDRQRAPGRYLLLGSTEFSRLALIRESLVGRMGRVRLYPLTLVEFTVDGKPGLAPNRRQLVRYLESGGMPGIFAVRNTEESDALFQDWIDLICYRDLHQFKTLKLDSELAFQIMRQSALQPEPTRARMADALKADSRRIATHLKALCELFVLQRLDPHPSGMGKPICPCAPRP